MGVGGVWWGMGWGMGCGVAQWKQSVIIENLKEEMELERDELQKIIREKDYEIEDLQQSLRYHQMQIRYQKTPSLFTEDYNLQRRDAKVEAVQKFDNIIVGDDDWEQYDSSKLSTSTSRENIESAAKLNAERKYKSCDMEVIKSFLCLAPIEIQVLNHGQQYNILRKEKGAKRLANQDIGDITIDMRKYSHEVNKIICEEKDEEGAEEEEETKSEYENGQEKKQ